jgi:hypothetical protein
LDAADDKMIVRRARKVVVDSRDEGEEIFQNGTV